MADGGGEAPLVGVIMGSDSDLPCMAAACEKLKQFGVSEPAETFKLVRGRKQTP
jgi:phosphoribosylcarboxyaminoimidazole (NCAIR) mutase